MGHLRLGARHFVGRFGRAGIAIAERKARDPARGAQIAVEQRRRERLDVGDVIEPGADGVGRQKRVDVDVKGEQVVNRLGTDTGLEDLAEFLGELPELLIRQ